MATIAAEPGPDPRLTIPPTAFPHVPRPRVVLLLKQAATQPVILVRGPAGSGKTAAVTEWVRTDGPGGRVAWLSMESGDTDPARFAESLRRAVGLPTVSRDDLRAALSAALGVGGVLVLDDVPEPGRTPELLDVLIRWPPEGVRLVLLCRAAPPRAVLRRRLARTIGTLGSADLAFTAEELAELLRRTGVDLPDGAASRLLASTAGWPGPLVQAALGPGVLDLSVGSELVGYLRSEVLDPLPPTARELLLASALMPSVDLDLAQRLVDRDDVADAYADLVARELLVPDPATGRERPPALLAAAAPTLLSFERPGLERQVRRAAAAWHEAADEDLAALRQAVAGRDWQFVGELALRSAATAIVRGQRGELTEALASLPPGITAGSPELELCGALAALSDRDGPAVHTLLGRAAPLVDRLPEPRRSIAVLVSRIVEASQAYRDGDAERMVAAAGDAERVMATLTADQAPGWARHRGAPQGLLATGEIWAGRPERALQILTASVAGLTRAELTGYVRVYYLAQLATATAGAGHLRAARRYAEECLATAATHGPGPGHETQSAWLALALAALGRADLREAGRAVAEGRAAAGQHLHPFVAAAFQLVTAAVALAEDDLVGARSRLRSVDDLLALSPGMVAVAQAAAATRIVLELAAGAPGAAIAADRAARDAGVPDTALLSFARALLALQTGAADRVPDLIAPLLAGGGALASLGWMLQARALEAAGRGTAATEALAQALDIADGEDLVLPFLHPDHRLAAALSRHLAVVGTHRDLVARALAGTSTERPVLDGRLTERELAVLAYLPSLGSNADIAAALHISENTVKQHLKTAYRKLGVGTRRDAVRVARQIGLLPG